MPAIPHLQPRFLENTSSGGISGTAIGLIVGFGLVPCIIIIWVVIFLFFAYPYDRNWCCMKRKKHKDNIPKMQNQAATDSSQETLHEKLAYDLPKRPYAAQSRTDSGSSSNSGRLMKERPAPGTLRHDTRFSLQSVGSANYVQGAQEPKPFV